MQVVLIVGAKDHLLDLTVQQIHRVTFYLTLVWPWDLCFIFTNSVTSTPRIIDFSSIPALASQEVDSTIALDYPR